MLALVSAALALAASAAADSTFTIIHWNDVHSRATPGTQGAQVICKGLDANSLSTKYTDPSCYGGYARLSQACIDAKADGSDVLCLDAGDSMQGTAWDTVYQGSYQATALNAVGIDAFTIGNHEFDFGIDALQAFVATAEFPVLGACNMDLTNAPKLAGIQKWTTVTMASGARVGILGYITQTTGNIVLSAGGARFLDEVTSMTDCLAAYKASPESEGVDVIGFLGHAGYDTDTNIATAFAGQINFVVGGHTHTPQFVAPSLVSPFMCNTFACPAPPSTDRRVQTLGFFGKPYPFMVGAVPVLQVFYGSKFFGKINLTAGPSGATMVNSAAVVPAGTYFPNGPSGASVKVGEDPTVVTLLDNLFAPVQSFGNEVLGQVAADLTRFNNQEHLVGNLCTDAILWGANRALPEDPTKPYIALFNGGGMRSNIPAGTITVASAFSVLPFANTLEIVEITGAVLKLVLENGLQLLASSGGRFPYIGGGLSVVWDCSKQAHVNNPDTNTIITPGSRVLEMRYNNKVVLPDSVFRLVTNNFITAGGDGYIMLRFVPQVLTAGPDMAQVLADFIKMRVAQSCVPGFLPLPFIEGRLVGNAVSCTPVPPPADVCSTSPKGTACDDGSKCTTGDTCTGFKKCVGARAPCTLAANACKRTSCFASLGCVQTRRYEVCRAVPLASAVKYSDKRPRCPLA